jgi:hypothetical protein
MATYLYCVRSDALFPPDTLLGLDGERVRALRAGDLLAWVSDVGTTSVPADVDRLRTHDAVCAAAMDAGDTPLPVRFGQAFADDIAAVDAVVARQSELLGRLGRIAGCVELRVVIRRGRGMDSPDPEVDQTPARTAGPAVASVDPEGPGTAFLKRLARAGRAELAREIGCEEARHAIRDAAKAIIVDQHRCETARGLAYFPVLVRRDDVSAFRQAVTNTLPSWATDLSILGPFPPYSFAADA